MEVRDAGMPQGAGMVPVDWECYPVRGSFVMEVEGGKGRERKLCASVKVGMLIVEIGMLTVGIGMLWHPHPENWDMPAPSH